MEDIKTNNKKWKSFLPGLVAFLILAIFLGLTAKGSLWGGKMADLVIVKPALAQDVYPLFICPCCGKTIDVGCCGMSKERMAFVDGLVGSGNLSEDEVVEIYVQKYGLNSFIDESRQEAFRQKLIDEAPEERPIIAISPATYDFGDVSQAKGVTETLFQVENTGKTDLVINKIETSCGCTSASIVYQGKEGPVFSMPGHGINEKVGDWQVAIAPNEIAQLKVYYDPNMHGDFQGAVIREIHVFSNDPIDFEAEVAIELTQVE